MPEAQPSRTTCPLTQAQVDELERLLLEMGEFEPSGIHAELDWFLHQLGLHRHYFEIMPLPLIAQHVAALKASRILNRSRGRVVDVHLMQEEPDRAMYVLVDTHDKALEIEHRMEEGYADYRISSFRTLGSSEGGHLRLYFAEKPIHPQGPCPADELDLAKIADVAFFNGNQPETLARYQQHLGVARGAIGPTLRFSEKPETRETRIMVAVPGRSAPDYFTAISDGINAYGLHSNRKYREPFANGTTVFTVYLDRVEDERVFDNLQEDLSLLYTIPHTELSSLFQRGAITAQAATYAFAAGTFAQQFLTGFSDEYQSIAAALRERPELMGTLQSLRTRLVKNSFSEERIYLAIGRNTELVQAVYDHFSDIHFARKKSTPLVGTALEERSEELRHRIKKSVQNENDRKILGCFLDFNRLVLRTNFYKNDKVSLAFRLKPDFLERADYPELPFAVYFVLSAEARAFHIRFRDVARGGIRIVRSANAEDYRINAETAFDENYNLAHTQQRKNKDIPEGGSKGVILLNPNAQERAELAFQKYIHGLLDLMLPNDEIRDLLGSDEILFLGPDEGTAELMNLASSDARRRGYCFWRAFTTGKSLFMGGVPHDLYGMTTRGVHEYVLRSLDKLGLREEEVTKVQTGGPDGDLGSNEILISRDRTLAVVDGSGVLYDPVGLDRGELSRLARERRMVRHFDRARLSAGGFLVTVEDSERTLPDGTFVDSGTDFRNTFHLSGYARADLFVPCGGRPRAVTIHNWKQLLDEDGVTPKLKVIVEGANLFITQEARLELEKVGVMIFKDATANKGGVTSSSLEVLASLVLTDDQYDQLMCVHDPAAVPAFRSRYVEAIWAVIADNARLEFDRLWLESERTGQPRSVLSDLLSTKINQVTDAIRPSDLWDDGELRVAVVTRACPAVLVETVGLEQILARVPDNYLRAMFASWLASRFVYTYGLDANEIDFLNFVRSQTQPTRN